MLSIHPVSAEFRSREPEHSNLLLDGMVASRLSGAIDAGASLAATSKRSDRLSPVSSGQSTGEGVGHSTVRCTQLSDVQSMILFVGAIAAIDALALAWRTTVASRARTLA